MGLPSTQRGRCCGLSASSAAVLRHRGQRVLETTRRQASVHCRHDVARAERVHPDPLWRPFGGERAAELQYGRFRRVTVPPVHFVGPAS
jgi:hypothetical protein